ncbi:patatin-like phospholipase family protein [Pontiellaceae bacterium B12227]|nr:patatin-like phospholipase family protein [Pontiellaceae bacterium B12227]
MKKVGLALGGGGARGLAHIPMLETLEAFGIKPAAISGTSIGSIVGALYASGKNAEKIRERLKQFLLLKDESLADRLSKTPHLLTWLSVMRVEKGRGGLINTDNFLKFLLEEIGVETFEELEIPLQVVATDFWTGEEVVFDSGPLRPAIQASMAVPGVFAPVECDERVLVDGGIVNNVPFDLLTDSCDFTIAVDVAPTRDPGEAAAPALMDSVLGMFDMLIEKVMDQKRAASTADIYILPKLVGVRVLDVDKLEAVYEMAKPAADELREQLIQHGFREQ